MAAEDPEMQRQAPPRAAPPRIVPPKEEEYELVPLGPVQRVEKRVERLEHAGIPTEVVAELANSVRANQRAVEEMVKRVSELTARINELVSSMKVSVPAEKEVHKELESKFEERLEKLEKRLNALVMAALPRRPRPAPGFAPAPMPGQMM